MNRKDLAQELVDIVIDVLHPADGDSCEAVALVSYCLGEKGIGYVLPPRLTEVSVHPGLEPMMEFFKFGHLPPHLQAVSRPFGNLAEQMMYTIDLGPERTAALRKLLEAKDAAVRATLVPGG